MAVHAKLETHGRHIYIYCHNYWALKQLPFLGKQTVPATLRKDFWRPMATVTFPNGHQGLEAYRQLREFRVRHEHEWTPEELGARTFVDGYYGTDLKAAGRRLQNQKANTVADLAFVLSEQTKLAERDEELESEVKSKVENAIKEAQESLPRIKDEMRAAKAETREGNDEAWNRYKDLKRQKLRIPRALTKARPDKYLAKQYDPQNDDSTLPKRGYRKQLRLAAQIPKFSLNGVRIAWADLRDAEFARNWPESVVHNALDFESRRHRHVAAPPGMLPIDDLDMLPKPEGSLVASSNLSEVSVAETGESNVGAPVPRKDTFLNRMIVRLEHGSKERIA